MRSTPSCAPLRAALHRLLRTLLLTTLCVLLVAACGRASEPGGPPAGQAPVPTAPRAVDPPPPVEGKPSDAMDRLQATFAAQAWLKIADEGDLGTAWDQAGEPLRTGEAREAWVARVGAARTPLGKPASRSVIGQEPATSVEGLGDGAFMIIRFQTAFATNPAVRETVTLARDGSGWRVVAWAMQ